MPRSTNQVARLKKLIKLAYEMVIELESGMQRVDTKRPKIVGRRRRSGKELTQFRKMLKAERKKGASVADIAKKHGVSTAYIYQLG